MNSFARGKALIIGVAQYTQGPLPAAVTNDASDVATLLRDPGFCGYADTAVTLLLDNEATKAAITDNLARLAASAGPDDTVLIFFSGHGGRVRTPTGVEGCLLPYDFGATGDNVLLGSELTNALAAIPAARVVLIMDACHSGGTAEPKGDADAVELGLADADYERLAAGQGRVVIASCKPNEKSYAPRHRQNSVFTEVLLKGLRGEAAVWGDGLVRVLDVFTFVADRVPQLDARQHPYFKGKDLDQNFPLALDRGGAKGSARIATVTARDDAWWRHTEALAAVLYPRGPTDSEIWSRAGGDLASLRDSETPRGRWHNAIKAMRLGGGGPAISIDDLLTTMLRDHPSNTEIEALRAHM